jgi:Protein of unknown function (DUF3396)
MGFKEDWGIERADALSALDAELRVVEDGKVLCSLGFVATFFVRRVDHPDVRERLVQALELYQSGIGDKLIWGADPKNSRPKKLAGTTLADVRSWMHKVGPSDDFSYVFHGGQNKEDADPYSAHAYVNPNDPAKLSFASFTWPLSWVAEHSVEAFAKLVAELAALIGPTHGYAGWAIVTHVKQRGSEPATRYVAAFAQRFRGLEVDQLINHSLILRKKDAIKGINWLTILGSPWVDRLGGLPNLKAALGDGIGVRSFGDGVVIQAGPRPLLGDVNRGEKMEAYHRVATALRPIRIDALFPFSIDYYGFGAEETARWLARFDVP